MIKQNQRQQNQLQQAQQASQQAQQAAQQAQAALAAAQQAQQAAQVAVAAPRLSPPPKFENKEKDLKIQQWLPMLDVYMAGTPNNQYFRMASSYLGGKPRSYWISKYEAWRAANNNQEPPNPPQFFRDVMTQGYGLVDPTQSYWDTWNKLSQGSSSIHDYNTAFQLALADLNREITDEGVKVEHYRAGLQPDLREMCRVSPDGTRWANLEALARYATLQWPTIEARLAKAKASRSTTKVAGKRKSTGGSPGRSSKARVSAVLSDEQVAHNMKHRLCHKCGKPGHIARDCVVESQDKSSKGKGKAKAGKAGEDF